MIKYIVLYFIIGIILSIVATYMDYRTTYSYEDIDDFLNMILTLWLVYCFGHFGL